MFQKPDGVRDIYYLWEDFEADKEKIVKTILQENGNNRNNLHQKFDGIHGIEMGGVVLAICLHYRLGLPIIRTKKEITERTLIVDDIADSGHTLSPYYKRNFIVTLFKNPNSKVEPNIWMREKEPDTYIYFPWEERGSGGVIDE